MHDKLAYTCPACRTPISVRLFPFHCNCGFTQYHNPPKLGDRVAIWLAKWGVTEKRYKVAKQAVGLKGKCGCKKRQRRLNKLGKQA